MMGYPVHNDEAIKMLQAWGLANCVGGPKGYSRTSSHVPVARGREEDWTNHKVELVGWVVQQCLDGHERVLVKMYFEPQSSGKRLSVGAISKKTSVHHKLINQVLDRCIGRVAQALSMPAMFDIKNNS